MFGTLYIVGTPIGNMEDITFRAVRILKEANLIVAEDTRNTRKLLIHYDIHTKAISYHKFSDDSKVNMIINTLKKGDNIALVSDAGTPCVSDPGNELVARSIKENIKIDFIPGACASLAALVLSGFDLSKGFAFLGFPPRKTSELRCFFESNKNLPYAFCIYESPHRLLKTLSIIQDVMENNRLISVSREITKLFEENVRGSAEELISYFSAKEIKGEIAIVIDFCNENEEKQITSDEIKSLLEDFVKKGYSKKDSIKLCAEKLKISKNLVYEIANKL